MTILRLGDNDVRLPGHMVSLPQAFIDILMQDNVERIVSSGVDPQDGGVYFVTTKAMIGVITSTARRPTAAIPAWNGEKVYVSFDDDLGIQGLDSTLVMSNSSNVIKGGTLHIGDRYICDVNIEQDEVAEDD